MLTVAVAGAALAVGFMEEKFFGLPPSAALALYILSYVAGGGVIPLSVAVVLHEGSTIAVVLNALRLLGWRERVGVPPRIHP